MYRHYCDICGSELTGTAKQIEIRDKEIPEYSTNVMSNPVVSSYSTATLDCTPKKIASIHEICNKCAEDIEKRMYFGQQK